MKCLFTNSLVYKLGEWMFTIVEIVNDTELPTYHKCTAEVWL